MALGVPKNVRTLGKYEPHPRIPNQLGTHMLYYKQCRAGVRVGGRVKKLVLQGGLGGHLELVVNVRTLGITKIRR